MEEQHRTTEKTPTTGTGGLADAEHPHVGWDDSAGFEDVLTEKDLAPLVRGPVRTLQVNVGRVCNQACHHCHVGAGPNRGESMSRELAEKVVTLLSASPEVELLDLTGGAPELNPNFRWLVQEARSLGRRVIDRNNLTVLREPGQEDLSMFLADHGVEVVASLPCYTAENVDNQRGPGVFKDSILGLQRLNDLGYGRPGSGLILNLVYNPGGSFLPASQAVLEEDYRRELGQGYGVVFNSLLTITNMPIMRFASALARDGEMGRYMSLLVNHFNRAAVPGLMCRSLISVAWDGTLYDCDFNQMLELRLGAAGEGAPAMLQEVSSLADLEGGPVATGSHCFGCTAGSGSSCSGALA